MKRRTLFICIHNSARSQMAEAFLRKYGGDNFEAESAGIEPGKMNNNVIEVMKEKGVDLSKKGTQGVFDIFKRGNKYDAVITVCDAASAEKCPVFPGIVKRESWSFADPSAFKGSQREILEQTRVVRDLIEETIEDFVQRASAGSYWI